MAEKGTISVNTENIFPIIKKFLYSDHEIFLRELVSNAVDATQKLQKLAAIGEFNGELGELKVKVAVDKEAKTITISDRGIGMTEEEIKKYINQIAFSGATEFLEKYKDADDNNQIIGHFGLGFYSAFMVAEQVEIITKSHVEDSTSVKWACEGSTSFEITSAEKEDRGTDIVLHINDDSAEFLEVSRIQAVLDKYTKFLPVEIEFDEKIVNNPNPIWTKGPSDLTDEDYINFYKELYPFAEEPLFWIHLNVDYPFNLTGILYFPKVKNDITMHKDKIQLYSRQVFITDEVKDIVPEFLMLLHGVIDSPDIPLNVSRSYLQADSNVKKINSYITKKVADKLKDLYKSDRADFEAKWDSIGLFIKYGIVSDEKFSEKAKDYVLLTNTEGKHFTMDEYKAQVAPTQTDKTENVVFLYTTDAGAQDSYIQSAKKKGYDVLELGGVLDSHFVGAVERLAEKVTLKRVDAELADKLIDTGSEVESVLSEDESNKITEIFKKAVGDEQAQISVESMATDDMPVTITVPEFMRRMQDMAKMQGGMDGMMGLPTMNNIGINANHSVTSKILKAESEEEQTKLAKQAYDLALLSQGLLTGKALTSFIQRSADLI
ncbi:MAG: molecular chaperone HtpG [Arenicella sp.]|jgi:molecular chaperone HtpG